MVHRIGIPGKSGVTIITIIGRGNMVSAFADTNTAIMTGTTLFRRTLEYTTFVT
jgi:hypothetical protein